MEYPVYSRSSGVGFNTFIRMLNTTSLVKAAAHLRNVDQTNRRIEETLKNAHDSMSAGLAGVQETIEKLGAAFNYGLGLVQTKLDTAISLNSDILTRLSEINQKLDAPDAIRSKEWYEKGSKLLSGNMLDLAFTSFQRSIEIDPANADSHHHIGMLHLYGVNEEVDLYDPVKADQCLKVASSLYELILDTSEEVNITYAHILFHRSIANYLIGNDLFGADEAQAKTCYERAISLAKSTHRLLPNFAEISYHLAKYYCVTQDTESAMPYVQEAVERDTGYIDKITHDDDFAIMRKTLAPFFDRYLTEHRKHQDRKEKLLGLLNEELSFLDSCYNAAGSILREHYSEAVKARAAKDAANSAEDIWQIFNSHPPGNIPVLPNNAHRYIYIQYFVNYREAVKRGDINKQKVSIKRMIDTILDLEETYIETSLLYKLSRRKEEILEKMDSASKMNADSDLKDYNDMEMWHQDESMGSIHGFESLVRDMQPHDTWFLR
jgi:tetratricopeptide (TPR) repeat protein